MIKEKNSVTSNAYKKGEDRNMVKKLGKIGLVAVLFMLNVSFIKAEECDNFNYILLDSKTMEECGTVEDFEISDDSLAFSCNGKEYEFDLEKVESKDEAECYSGNDGDVFCNMAEEEGNIGIQVINKDIYPEDRTVQNGNFTIIATNVDKEEIAKAIEDNEELKIIEENNNKK